MLADDAVIDRFVGHHEHMSNFFRHTVRFRGITWPTKEHAYQAYKSRDSAHWKAILSEPDPGQAKRMSKKGRVELRPHWDEYKVPLMEQIVWSFYRDHDDCRTALFETYPATLIEGNTWHDNEWGNCTCGSGTCIKPGKNMLGTTLMFVRRQLTVEYWDQAEAAGMGAWPE